MYVESNSARLISLSAQNIWENIKECFNKNDNEIGNTCLMNFINQMLEWLLSFYKNPWTFKNSVEIKLINLSMLEDKYDNNIVI